MIIDKGAADEVLVLQCFGIQIDIAGLIDDINNNDSQYQLHECSTSRLLEANRTDGINKEVLAQMTESQSNQPILITAIDGYEWIIDGNHRLLKRAELAKESSRYIPISGVQLDPFVSEFSWR
jgi:hypothetical protein